MPDGDLAAIGQVDFVGGDGVHGLAVEDRVVSCWADARGDALGDFGTAGSGDLVVENGRKEREVPSDYAGIGKAGAIAVL